MAVAARGEDAGRLSGPFSWLGVCSSRGVSAGADSELMVVSDSPESWESGGKKHILKVKMT